MRPIGNGCCSSARLGTRPTTLCDVIRTPRRYRPGVRMTSQSVVGLVPRLLFGLAIAYWHRYWLWPIGSAVRPIAYGLLALRCLRLSLKYSEPLLKDTSKMQTPLSAGHHCSVSFDFPCMDTRTHKTSGIRTLS